jgi:hypothetical protein
VFAICMGKQYTSVFLRCDIGRARSSSTPGSGHVCIFGTCIGFFENRTIPSILRIVEFLEICDDERGSDMTSARHRRARERMETLIVGVLWRTACESLVESFRSTTLDAFRRESQWPRKFSASPALDLGDFDATPPVLRRVVGDCARQTTLSCVQGEHLERAESGKVTVCAVSV